MQNVSNFLYCLYSWVVFIFILIDDTDFFGTTADESSTPDIKDNGDFTPSKEMDRERGL